MSLLAVDIDKFYTPATTFPTVGSLVDVLVKNFFVVVSILLFLLLIFSGLKFMMSSGDEKGAEQSKNAMTSAIIGLAVIFLAFWIVQIIQFITGVKIFNSGI